MNTTRIDTASDILGKAGILNPRRLITHIRDTIAHLNLDLSGLNILTEAASGPYMVTPIIASLAGAAKIMALTRDSSYASSNTVIEQTRALEELCNAPRKIEIYTKRPYKVFKQADVITNLGFVRPIDANIISMLKPSAVITLMCEAWEYRSSDVDIDACKNRGISVLGTNEDYPGLDIFAYSGWLCLKLLFDAQIEIHKSRAIIVSSDKFGKVIQRLLERCGINTVLTSKLNPQLLPDIDVLIIADYSRDDEIIGQNGDITVAELARIAPDITLIQFAGRIAVKAIRKLGLTVFPGIELQSHRMAKTLAHLGPRPVVELHTAGLKVGEIAARNRNKNSASITSDKLIQKVY